MFLLDPNSFYKYLMAKGTQWKSVNDASSHMLLIHSSNAASAFVNRFAGHPRRAVADSTGVRSLCAIFFSARRSREGLKRQARCLTISRSDSNLPAFGSEIEAKQKTSQFIDE